MFIMRSVDGRIWSPDFGRGGSDDETPFLIDVPANPEGKNYGEHYLVGSFGGALSS